MEICKLPPSLNLTRLVFCYHSASGQDKSNKSIQSSVEKLLAGFKNSKKITSVRGTLLPKEPYPIKIGIYFLLFILDVLQMYQQYVKDPHFSDKVQCLFIAYAKYCDNPNDHIAATAFQDACREIYSRLESVFPFAEKIIKDFKDWNDLIAENIDFLELTLDELDNIHRKNKSVLYITSKDCLTLIRKLTDLTDFLVSTIHPLICKQVTQIPQKAVADSWALKETEYQKLLDKHEDKISSFQIAPDFHGALPGETSPVIINGMAPPSHLQQHLSQFINEIKQITCKIKQTDNANNIRKLVSDMGIACDKVVGNQKSHLSVFPREHTAFLNYTSSVKRLEDTLSVLLQDQKEHPEAEDKEQIQDLIQFFRARLKAVKIITLGNQIIDSTVLSVYVDFLRLSEGYQTRIKVNSKKKRLRNLITVLFPTSEEKIRAAQMGNELCEDESTRPTTRRGRNSNTRSSRAKRHFQGRKNRGRQNTSPSQPLEQKQKTSLVEKEQEEQEKHSVTMISLSSSHDADELHRRLSFQYARLVPTILSLKKMTPGNLCRLVIPTLHRWLETTLTKGAENKGLQLPKTHSLWTYRKVVNVDKKVISDLHYGNHWGRWPLEMNSLWGNLSTLPARPHVLTWLQDKSKTPLSEEKTVQIHKWLRQGETISSQLFKTNSREITPQQVSAVDLQAPGLVQALEKIKAIPNKTLWICQWKNDLSDLKETVNLLLEGNYPLRVLPVLIEHILLLTTGIVQSPLYALQVKDNQKHSRHHNLKALWEECSLPLTEAASRTFTELLDGIGLIHRYPFKDSVRSKAHRLLLNGIAIGLFPELNDGFQPAVKGKKEGEVDAEGRPYLNEYLNADQLRKELIGWLEQVVQLTQEPLIKELAKS